VLIKKNEPVEILAEFEKWRKIRDKSGDEGWVHESMLSGKRYIIITGNKNITAYKKPDEKSSPLFKLEPEVRAKLNKCDKNWCLIEIEKHRGWVQKTHLWGVYNNEELG
jgi:SH3-like domain-containing protein